MKRRLIASVAAVAVCLSAGVALIGCGGNNNGGASADSTDKSASPALRYDTTLRFDSKYYTRLDGTDEERGYYIFSANGTGKYYYYYCFQYKDTSEIENYTISFKYIFTNADKTQIACFYDGVTYTARDNQKKVSSGWDRILDVSEEILIGEGQYGRYLAAVNEEFQKQIPNYGVETKS